jgi:hypothetical protein
MYKLHLLNKGVEDADWVINVLDAFYPNKSRTEIDGFEILKVYRIANSEYVGFSKFAVGINNG